jgi:hypothetical protein
MLRQCLTLLYKTYERFFGERQSAGPGEERTSMRTSVSIRRLSSMVSNGSEMAAARWALWV